MTHHIRSSRGLTLLFVSVALGLSQSSCSKQARIWQSRHGGDTPLSISVNLSGKQFKQPDLVDRVKQVLYQTGLDASALRLEITESMIMENADAATAMLRQLRSINVQLSIDDFGTGYSSLSYLHRFPVNILKIDKSFVSRMSMDEESLGIVETIITLASKLKMNVVAEGIETPEQCEKLKALHCQYGQGYLFSKPVPADVAEQLVDDDAHLRGVMNSALVAPPDQMEIVNPQFSM